MLSLNMHIPHEYTQIYTDMHIFAPCRQGKESSDTFLCVVTRDLCTFPELIWNIHGWVKNKYVSMGSLR